MSLLYLLLKLTWQNDRLYRGFAQKKADGRQATVILNIARYAGGRGGGGE